MKRLCSIFAALFVVLLLQAQSNLLSLSSLRLSGHDSREQLLKDILGNDVSKWGKCLSYVEVYPHKGFCIDNNTILYTKLLGPNDTLRTALTPKEKNIHALSELWHVALATSSSLAPDGIFIDAPIKVFTCGLNAAECYGGEDSLSTGLVNVAKAVCEACVKNDESIIDSLYNQITDLTVSFKKKLYYNFRDNGDIMRVGCNCNYVDVWADFSAIERKNASGNDEMYKETMLQVAHHLVENSDGPIYCHIVVLPSMKSNEYLRDSIFNINVSIDDFTPKRMWDVCKKILCCHQKAEKWSLFFYDNFL